MAPEAAYDAARALVGGMYGVGADRGATEAAVTAVADALLAAVAAERAAWVAACNAVRDEYQALAARTGRADCWNGVRAAEAVARRAMEG
jgi:hypothetical protein